MQTRISFYCYLSWRNSKLDINKEKVTHNQQIFILTFKDKFLLFCLNPCQRKWNNCFVLISTLLEKNDTFQKEKG